MTTMSHAFENAGYIDSNIVNVKFSSEPEDDSEDFQESSCALGNDDRLPALNQSMLHWDFFRNERDEMARRKVKGLTAIPTLRRAVAEAVAYLNKMQDIRKQKLAEYEWLGARPAHTGEDELAKMNLADEVLKWTDKVNEARKKAAAAKGNLKSCESLIKYASVLEDVTQEYWDEIRFPVGKNKELMLALAYGIRERLHFLVVLRQKSREMFERQLAKENMNAKPEYAESISLDSDMTKADELNKTISKIKDEISELTTISYCYKAMSVILEKQLGPQEQHFFRVGGQPRTTSQMRESWDNKAIEKAQKTAEAARNQTATIVDYEDIS